MKTTINIKRFAISAVKIVTLIFRFEIIDNRNNENIIIIDT